MVVLNLTLLVVEPFNLKFVCIDCADHLKEVLLNVHVLRRLHLLQELGSLFIQRTDLRGDFILDLDLFLVSVVSSESYLAIKLSNQSISLVHKPLCLVLCVDNVQLKQNIVDVAIKLDIVFMVLVVCVYVVKQQDLLDIRLHTDWVASDLCDLLFEPAFLVLNAILDNTGQQDLELLEVIFR